MSSSVHVNGTELLSSKEAAIRFGYTSDYVSRLARQGKITATRVGHQWFVDPASLDILIRNTELSEKTRYTEIRKERQIERRVSRDLPTENSTAFVFDEKLDTQNRISALKKSFAIVLFGLVVGFVYSEQSTLLHGGVLASVQSTFEGVVTGESIFAYESLKYSAYGIYHGFLSESEERALSASAVVGDTRIIPPVVTPAETQSSIAIFPDIPDIGSTTIVTTDDVVWVRDSFQNPAGDTASTTSTTTTN